MKKDDCIFCKLANGEIPTNALYEDDIVKVIFDASPAAKGHVLILPKEHFDNIYELDDETAAHVFKVAAKISKAYKKAYCSEQWRSSRADSISFPYAYYS